MEITAAVLRSIGASRPFTTSRPLLLERLELAPPGPGELAVRV